MPKTLKEKAEEGAQIKAAQEKESADFRQKIVFERSHPDFAYWPGDKATLSPEHTANLVNGGFARFDAAETADAPTDEQR